MVDIYSSHKAAKFPSLVTDANEIRSMNLANQCVLVPLCAGLRIA